MSKNSAYLTKGKDKNQAISRQAAAVQIREWRAMNGLVLSRFGRGNRCRAYQLAGTNVQVAVL